METVNLDYVPIRRGDRVLDLGCGEGRHAIAAWLRAEVHCVGIDLSVQDVATAAARARPFAPERPGTAHCSLGFGVGNALQLPFADHCFDVVICSEVLEHIGPYREVLAEIRRVLKPGGALVASAVEHPAVTAYHRLLVWDLMERPRLTRWVEALLNPVLGKSVVMYFQKAPVP